VVNKTAVLLALAGLVACFLQPAVAADADKGSVTTPKLPVNHHIDYRFLQRKIIYGRATLAEVRQALTDRDIGELTNTLHALYSMRWHRGVIHLLYDMWNKKKKKYPELSWDIIGKAPARIALASTISRIQITGTKEYLDYIRSHEHDKRKFKRAQVVIALGFNGNISDVAYIKSMAEGDDTYVAQSAITALALMGHKPASDALIDLWFKYRHTPRGKLVQEVLRQAYHLTPHERKAGEKKSADK
jgi:hypothetical protein